MEGSHASSVNEGQGLNLCRERGENPPESSKDTFTSACLLSVSPWPLSFTTAASLHSEPAPKQMQILSP